jgi:hypothetical protein
VVALLSDISDILKIVDLREGKIWDAGRPESSPRMIMETLTQDRPGPAERPRRSTGTPKRRVPSTDLPLTFHRAAHHHRRSWSAELSTSAIGS